MVDGTLDERLFGHVLVVEKAVKGDLLAPCVGFLHNDSHLEKDEEEQESPLFPSRLSFMRLAVSMVIVSLLGGLCAEYIRGEGDIYV
jgi:hypothetical protein